MCQSLYGQRPQAFLEHLGVLLDPELDVIGAVPDIAEVSVDPVYEG